MTLQTTARLAGRLEAQRDEVARLSKLIDDTASHWLRLVGKGPVIPWEGAIDAAMAAAVGEIERLRAALAEIIELPGYRMDEGAQIARAALTPRGP